MKVLKPTEFLLERDLKVSRKHYHLPGSAVYITTKACPEFTALFGVSTGELLNSTHGETNRKGDRRKL